MSTGTWCTSTCTTLWSTRASMAASSWTPARPRPTLSPSRGRPAGTQNSFTFRCWYLLPMDTAWYQVNCLHHGGGQQVHKTVLHSGVGTYYQWALHGIKWIVSIKGEASRYANSYTYWLPILYILVTDTDTDTGINESTNFRQNLLPTSTLWVLHCVQLTCIEIQWWI